MTTESTPAAEEDCLFCAIVRGDVPSDKVAETERVLAFRDIQPQAPTHILVIPKVHIPTLPELAQHHPGDTLAVLTTARQVAIDDGVGGGYRLVANNGAPAQQSVFHAHVHVLGGRAFTWPPG